MLIKDIVLINLKMTFNDSVAQAVAITFLKAVLWLFTFALTVLKTLCCDSQMNMWEVKLMLFMFTSLPNTLLLVDYNLVTSVHEIGNAYE